MRRSDDKPVGVYRWMVPLEKRPEFRVEPEVIAAQLEEKAEVAMREAQTDFSFRVEGERTVWTEDHPDCVKCWLELRIYRRLPEPVNLDA